MADRDTRRRRSTRPTSRWGGGRPIEHGLQALERRLKSNALDGRSQTARMLRSIATDLAQDRGGWDHCTAAERILIERCAAITLLCSSIEAHVFRQDSPIDLKTGELLAVLRRGYVSHFSALTRALQALGLERRQADDVPNLEDYLRERSAENGAASPADDPDAAPEPDRASTGDVGSETGGFDGGTE